MKIGNWLFIKMNNEFGKHFTALSLGLLAALGATMTVAQADQTTDYSVPGTFLTQYNNENSRNYLIQKPVYFKTDRLNRSFNVNQIIDQQQAFHQALKPQRLELPKSSTTKRIKHQRSLFLIKVQILVSLYILFRNFVPLFESIDKCGSKIHISKTMSQPSREVHKKKTVNVTIKFHDIYGNQDVLKNPNKLVKSGIFNRKYIITAPSHWIFIQSNGMITDHMKFNYRDGDHDLNVIPIYKGLTYKYNQATQTLEFTHGSVNDRSNQSFLSQANVPKGISVNKVTTVKFDNPTHINGFNWNKMFNYDPYLQLVDVKGFIINRPRPISKVKSHVFEKYHHEESRPFRHLASHQAETDALNELSIIMGGLNDEHRQNN